MDNHGLARSLHRDADHWDSLANGLEVSSPETADTLRAQAKEARRAAAGIESAPMHALASNLRPLPPAYRLDPKPLRATPYKGMTFDEVSQKLKVSSDEERAVLQQAVQSLAEEGKIKLTNGRWTLINFGRGHGTA